MSRYKTTKSSNDSIGRAVIALATCGISEIFGNTTNYSTTVRDNATGKSSKGYGSSYSKSKDDAVNHLRRRR